MIWRIFKKLTGLLGTGDRPNPHTEYFYDMGYLEGFKGGGGTIEPPMTVPEHYRKDWWAGYHVGRGRSMR